MNAKFHWHYISVWSIEFFLHCENSLLSQKKIKFCIFKIDTYVKECLNEVQKLEQRHRICYTSKFKNF